MTRDEAKEFLIDISYMIGNTSVEYLSEKDGEKMREAIEAIEQEPILDKISAEIKELATFDTVDTLIDVNKIINKYKAGSEKQA